MARDAGANGHREGSGDAATAQVDTRQADQLAQIGSRLRVAREERGMTINRVADFTGLTKGFISQVERGKAAASVASLAAICDALNLPMGQLFEPPRVWVMRASERHSSRLVGTGIKDFVLTPQGQRGLQVIETTIAPGGGGDPVPYRLPVDREFVTVLEGELEITIESEAHRLAVGDALGFDARHAHTWRNPSSDHAARVLWVLWSATD